MDEVVEGDDVAIPEHLNTPQLMTNIFAIIGIKKLPANPAHRRDHQT